ncbi:MAG: transcriptional antiterminator Rof [Arcobacter sp.]|nr:MAG: transcriptional antiterminator Rof [Arcobacter sp.]
MYNPISCEFFDQLNVAMQRKIPSTIVYYDEKEENKFTVKGIVKTMEVIDGIEFLILEKLEKKEKEKIKLHLVITFNGKRHREV